MSDQTTPPSEGAQHPSDPGHPLHRDWEPLSIREARRKLREWDQRCRDFGDAQAAEIDALQARLDAVLAECAKLRDESRDGDFDDYDRGYSRAYREAADRIERAAKVES